MYYKYCPIPFQNIEINPRGEVFTCCPNWNNNYIIGNIFENSFDEIWNSEKAVEFRKRILNNDYSLCDKNSCFYLKGHLFGSDNLIDFKSVMNDFPKIVKFSYDPECNIACKICRDKIVKLSEEEFKILDDRTDTLLLPILKHAKTLIINSAGDPFGSRHSRKVIKKAAQEYPDLKFVFHTNGILCNEKNLKELGVFPYNERITEVLISIHAATAKTYGKIVPSGEKLFPLIMDNLKFLNKHNIRTYLNFVVLPDNYKEIPDFIKLAEKYNSVPNFWEYRKENCNWDNKEDWFIYKDEHPLNKELIKVLKHPKVKQYRNFISPVLCNLIDK